MVIDLKHKRLERHLNQIIFKKVSYFKNTVVRISYSDFKPFSKKDYDYIITYFIIKGFLVNIEDDLFDLGGFYLYECTRLELC